MKKSIRNANAGKRLLPAAAFIAAFASALTLGSEEYQSVAAEPKAAINTVDYAKTECCVQIIPKQATTVKEIGPCKVTFYCPCRKCNGNDDKVARDGSALQPFLNCAVDPAVIPLGSEVFVDFGDGNIWVLKATDTGSAIKGNIIDICVDTHDHALDLGVMQATVSFLV